MPAGVSAGRLMQVTDPKVRFPQKVICMSQPPNNIRLTTYSAPYLAFLTNSHVVNKC